MRNSLLFPPASSALGVGIGLVLLAISSNASAHQVDAPGDHRHGTYEYDYTKNRSKQWAAFELRFGPYKPRVDSEFSGVTPYEDAFGSKASFSVGFEGSFQALRIPYFGTLGPGLGIHWFRKSGIAQFEPGAPPEIGESQHENSLWILPMYGVAVLRVDVLARELRFPLVPYAKGGFAWAFWESRDAGSVSVGDDGKKARGIETGLQAQLGLMFLLNPLAPQAAIDMDNHSGINNAYVFAELFLSDVDSFGSGMQVGAQTWFAGLALEY